MLLAFSAAATLYTGSLSSADGTIDGTGFWVDPASIGNPSDYVPTVFSWEVSENPDSSWNYRYELQVYRAETSHWILETSDAFTGTSPDLQNATGDYGTLATDSYSPGGGNPFMPDDVYGIKFDETSGEGTASGPNGNTLVYTVDFDSIRMPVWSDFYAKCGAVGGTQNTAWNLGFTNPDSDPVEGTALQNGSVDNHILAPDSVVPEPSTLTLLMLGLGLLAARRGPRRCRP